MILSVLVSDRGHAPALPEEWAEPRCQRGIVQTIDLHATQRKAAFDAANNCAWIGGWPARHGRHGIAETTQPDAPSKPRFARPMDDCCPARPRGWSPGSGGGNTHCEDNNPVTRARPARNTTCRW